MTYEEALAAFDRVAPHLYLCVHVDYLTARTGNGRGVCAVRRTSRQLSEFDIMALVRKIESIEAEWRDIWEPKKH